MCRAHLQLALALVLIYRGDGGLHGGAQLGQHERHQVGNQGQGVGGSRAHRVVDGLEGLRLQPRYLLLAALPLRLSTQPNSKALPPGMEAALQLPNTEIRLSPEPSENAPVLAVTSETCEMRLLDGVGILSQGHTAHRKNQDDQRAGAGA